MNLHFEKDKEDKRLMGPYLKGCVAGLLISAIVACLCFLINNSYHDTAVFIAQSIVDNAIFCGMFILVVLMTGISC